VGQLSFTGAAPDAAELSQRWRAMLAEAREVVQALPPQQAGKCVLNAAGNLFTGNLEQLQQAAAENGLRFHEARLHGAYPQVRSQ